MKKFFVGIDNGVTGSICIMSQEGEIVCLDKVPVKKEKDYHISRKKNVTRVDFRSLCLFFDKEIFDKKNVFICIERPMTNSFRYIAAMSAIRCFESFLICLESKDLINNNLFIIDSREWQKKEFGSCKGEDLKKLSINKGREIYKNYEGWKKDFDAVFIAEYLRENYKRMKVWK